MPYLTLVERTVPVSRAKFFAELADFGGVKKVVPDQVESVTLEGDGVGAVRTVRLKGVPGELKERLEALVDQRLLSYSIVNEVPLPIDRYHAVGALDAAPGGGTKVRWGSNWVAKGAPDAEVQKMLVGLYNTLIDGIVKLAS